MLATNGIVHVTAQDKGTGKSTDITITSSTNLSEDEIDKAVKDAEKFAEEDKKRKEKVDNKNNLDGMIFSVEQTIKDSGDKLDENDKTALQSAVDAAKKDLESDDDDKIKAAYDTLMNSVQPIFAKLYQANGGQPGPDAGGAGAGDGDTEFHQ